MNEPQDLVAVRVDEEVCIGAGQCEMLEEGTFLIDDDTAIAKVIGSGRLPRDRADVVIERCPSGAISLASDEIPAAKEEE